MTERWKKVKDFPYVVSDRGRIRSLRRTTVDSIGRVRKRPPHFLKPGISKKLGYPVVVLCNGTRQMTKYVHLLVSDAFLPPCPEGHEVNHINGDKSDPYYRNLEYLTHQENSQHSIDIGTRKKFKSKLTEVEVREIRRKYIPRRYTLSQLAKEYSVDYALVWMIIHRQIWKRIK